MIRWLDIYVYYEMLYVLFFRIVRKVRVTHQSREEVSISDLNMHKTVRQFLNEKA